jgi:EAL domain-containing protein (putative c-di-GMP-specific phosphodiesterase class I)
MDSRLKDRRQLEFDLREAIMCGAFELCYQPLVKTDDSSIVGFECLLRWPHSKRGMIAPADFIPLAEETGLIVPLGEWVLRAACDEAALWPPHVKVAVNLSPVQFKAGNLVEIVRSALANAGLLPERLELEITEAVLIKDDELALTILHELRSIGVRIAMDDFGTGYSSLSYLHRFPFDKIKIDRSFIRNLGASESSLTIIQAVVGIARARDIVTTAEGVETEQQFAILRDLGVSEIQGFLFSPPLQSKDVWQFSMLNDETLLGAA